MIYFYWVGSVFSCVEVLARNALQPTFVCTESAQFVGVGIRYDVKQWHSF